MVPDLTVAQKVAQAARDLQLQRTGHAPGAVSVVASGDTLVITLHEALTPAERALAKDPAGAAKVQNFHRQLFAANSETLKQAIERITGVSVREAAAEVDTHTGAVIHVFSGGTMVQVFLLAGDVASGDWHQPPSAGAK